MVRFAVSQNVNKNNTSLMIMHEYTRRHVHVTSLDLTSSKIATAPSRHRGATRLDVVVCFIGSRLP